MGISLDRLHPAPMPLKGFMGDVVQPMRAITISVLAGKAPKIAAIMSDFLVVNALSSYNSILGRPTLNSLRAVTSTYYLKMKFSTNSGVGEVRGEQVLGQECYDRELKHQVKLVAAIRKAEEAPKLGSPPPLTKWDEEIRDEQALWQAEPNEPLELVAIDQLTPVRRIQIGTKLGPEIKAALISLIVEH
ncbi:hypothetical protein F2P56_008964 [Juglans regia]|uniref:Uncharacterized protein LOC109011826 n=2 Tax=Juglans regia TaxID=51240 RepID=A0A2I4GXU6_JUGRE|nr:uncharacterized protein LOC109011826 [Juglans regia]KAF5472227.1 hypothetical protein F2P56_008964 [Juglans regia]